MELIILTYHYVDEPKRYRAGIYPVSPEMFQKQLDILGEKYIYVSERELAGALEGVSMPEKSALVTFDDGLRDQYHYAVPILRALGIPAVFFISTRHLAEKKANVVHKIHFILSQTHPRDLQEHFEDAYKASAGEPFDWSEVDTDYIRRWYIYDDEETAVFKYIVNHILEPSLAEMVADHIFVSVSDKDEETFVDEWYMRHEEIKDIADDPLFSLGLHSHSHIDISRAADHVVVEDFAANQRELNIRFGTEPRGLSYPFGKVGEKEAVKIIHTASALGLSYGVTTRKGVNQSLEEPLLLKRLNPNDYFKKR